MRDWLDVLLIGQVIFLVLAFLLAVPHWAQAGVMCTSTRVGNTVYTYCTGN